MSEPTIIKTYIKSDGGSIVLRESEGSMVPFSTAHFELDEYRRVNYFTRLNAAEADYARRVEQHKRKVAK